MNPLLRLGIVRPTRRPRPAASVETRIIDLALHRARIHLLPREQQDRIRAACQEATATETNAGAISRIVEERAGAEVNTWLQQHREAEAAVQEKVHEASNPARAEKSKLRAQRWRNKKKMEDPEFKDKEKQRKQTERAESSRQDELDELLKSGRHPTNIERLRQKAGPLLYATNEAGERTPLVSGGYNFAKLDEVEIASRNAQGGPDAVARPNRPEGHGDDSLKPYKRGYISKYLPSKEARAMRKYIVSHTDERPIMICLVCHEQIAPDFSFEAGFSHLQDAHPELFQDMLAAVKKARRCPEDHEGMAARHGTGDRKLYCRKCRKLLYSPKTAQLPKAA